MKKALLITFLFTYFLGQAQITYQASDYATLDDTLLFSSMTPSPGAFDFEDTGTNMNWDFSALDAANQGTSHYFDPENSGYKNGWCLVNAFLLNCNTNFQALTNRAIQNRDSLSVGSINIENNVAHEFLSGSALERKMIGISATIEGNTVPLTFDYEDTDIFYQFPLTYGGADSSTSLLILDLSPAPVTQVRRNKRVNRVEGWGSLTTPYGTFSDVLKMKTVIERTDTTYLDSATVPVSITEVEYKWWSADYGFPVLTASGTLIGNTTTITNVSYLDSTRCVDPTAYFIFTPVAPIVDPATQTVDVQFTNFSTNADSVRWDFGDGQESNASSPNHTFNSVGVFPVLLTAYNSCESTIVIDTLTLPVVVIDTTVTLGLNELESIIGLQVYPNPTTDQVTIESLENGTLSVLNMDGESLMKEPLSKNTSLDLSILPKGLYYIHVETELGVLSRKIILE